MITPELETQMAAILIHTVAIRIQVMATQRLKALRRRLKTNIALLVDCTQTGSVTSSMTTGLKLKLLSLVLMQVSRSWFRIPIQDLQIVPLENLYFLMGLLFMTYQTLFKYMPWVVKGTVIRFIKSYQVSIL